MLDIQYSIKYETLVNSLSEKLFDSSIWNDPFNPPVVVFSDTKIEKHFKLSFIKSRKDDILMNLKTCKLEGMLFSSLSDGFEHPDVRYERLTQQVLRTKILNKLISKMPDGSYYYQSLNAQDVVDYIEMIQDDGSVGINKNNLYTFAKNLAMLFNDYMDSRNDDCFHCKWMNDESYFDYSNCPPDDEARFTQMETWQRRIYRDLFSEIDTDKASIKYVTLAQLAEINARNNGGTLSLRPVSSNIFLFGFNSLGQFYRSLLSKIAANENTNMHVYLQSNGIVGKEYKNPLLQQWNKTGRDNFALWTQTDKAKTECVKTQPASDNAEKTLLHELQDQIAENSYDNQKLMDLAKGDSSITICGAPSPLKEIEALHSSVCSIINETRKEGKPAGYSDFIVLTPDLEAYKVPVMQVFDEIERNEENEKEFPYIPYVFSDHSGENSAVTEALGVLINILTCNSLNRPDLFTLLRNPVVKAARGFSEDELSAWSAWVSNLNGFRNSGNRKDEWQTLTKRLLISTLTENVFIDESGKCKPYSDMDSQDTNSMYKFVAAVDSLEKWRIDFASKKELSPSDVEEISDFLDTWFEMPSEQDDVLKKERIMYSAVRGEIENQKVLFKTGYDTLDADSFFHTLKDSAAETNGSGSNMYLGGITFSKLTQNRTIPAKYVYILGLNTDRFPGTATYSSLDLRKGEPEKTGDDTISDKEKEAFLCQVMAAGEKLYLSYINTDLKKDAELFRSSVVDDIVYCIAGDMTTKSKEEREQLIKKVESALVTGISIDEDREWEELFTHRSMRNKNNFENVLKQKQQTDNPYSHEPKQLPAQVRISEMKQFLENPFKHYIGQFINTNTDDDESEIEAEQFEPIRFDNLTKVNATSGILNRAFDNPSKTVNEITGETFDDMELMHAVPDAIFGEVSKGYLKDDVTKAVEQLRQFTDYDFKEYVFDRTINLPLQFKNDDMEREWTLMGEVCPYCWNKADNTLRVLGVVCSDDIKTKHKIKPYLTAMSVIAERQDDNPCNVELMIIHLGELESFALTRTFSRAEAKNILNEIYQNMNLEKDDIKPFKKVILIDNDEKGKGKDKDKIKTDYDSFADFISKVKEDKYFPQKELFNPYRDFGYDVATFKSEYPKAVNNWLAMVPGLF